MFKVNVNGTVLWNNTLGSVSGLQSSDGYLVLLTYTTESNSPTYTTSAILRKVDEQGNAAWSKTFSTGENLVTNGVLGNSLMETSDGGYAVTGSWNSSLWFLKTDTNGNVLFNQTYSLGNGTQNYEGQKIIQTKDGGYLIIAGVWLVKIDSQAAVQWIQRLLGLI